MLFYLLSNVATKSDDYSRYSRHSRLIRGIRIILFYEERYSSEVLRKRQSDLRLRQRFYHRLHQAGVKSGFVLGLPSFLYRQTKISGYGPPRRKIPGQDGGFQQDHREKNQQKGKTDGQSRQTGGQEGGKRVTAFKRLFWFCVIIIYNI
jgi:hypothetical protein